MERAFIVGMDSEWKAAFLSNTSRTPRVSIFQIACRIYDYGEEHISEADEQSKEARVSLEECRGEVVTEGFDVSRRMQNFVPKFEEAKWKRQLFEEVGNGEERRVQELIFLLDLLVLPLSSFGKTLRSVFISVDILKLGFKFKQDLIYLSGTFSDNAECLSKGSNSGLPGVNSLDIDKDFFCPICMQMIKDAFLTACGHSFFYTCIMTHLKDKNNCPCCGQYLTKEQLYPNFLLDKVSFLSFNLYFKFKV